MKVDSLDNNGQEIIELDYSGKDAQVLIKEFSVLLNCISSNYENRIIEIEKSYTKQIGELVKLCNLHENRVQGNRKLLDFMHIKIYKFKLEFKKQSKAAIKFAVYPLANIGKKIVVGLGIKAILKDTFIFKALYKKGIIDKIFGRNIKK